MKPKCYRAELEVLEVVVNIVLVIINCVQPYKGCYVTLVCDLCTVSCFVYDILSIDVELLT